MRERWTGLRMMVGSLIGIVLIGRLIFHIAGFAFFLFIIVAVLLLVLYAGSQSLLRR